MRFKKLDNGKWKGVIEVGKNPKTGKRMRKTRTRDTKEKAKEALAEILLKYKGDELNDDLTIEMRMRQWLKIKKNEIGDRTYEEYERVIRKHIIPELGKLKIKDLKEQHVLDFLNDKEADGYSNQSLKHFFTILKAGLRKYINKGKLEAFHEIKAPSPEPDPPDPFTEKEVVYLLKLAEGKWIHNINHLAVNTGLRRGEICALHRKHIDLINGAIKVESSAKRVKGEGVVYGKPKTKSSYRKIVISDDVILVLKKQLQWIERQRKEFGPKWNKEDLIFPLENGNVLDPRMVNRRYKKLTDGTPLEGHTFHDLRHTHATLLLKAGVHPKVVQERLGHASIKTTLDVYSQVVPSLQSEAAEKFSNLLNQASKKSKFEELGTFSAL